jgi:hypothetical protein
MLLTKINILERKLLKLKFRLEQLYKRFPDSVWFKDQVEGVDLAITEFNAVFFKEKNDRDKRKT